MRIVRIRPHRDRTRVILEVDDGEPRRFTLSEETVVRSGLRVGQTLDASSIEEILGQDSEIRAKDTALRLLGTRARGRAELKRRLRARGFSADTANRSVDELAAAGLVDDQEYAKAFVRSRIRSRPRSPGVIAQELRARGIPENISAQALRDILEEEQVAEVDLARRVAARFIPRRGEDLRKRRRRLYNLLARKGFESDTIRQVVDEVVGSA